MKKIFPLLATSLIALTGCNSSPKKVSFIDSIYRPGDYYHQESYELDLSVVAPTGAPAVAMYGFVGELNGRLTTSSNPAVGVIPMFQSQEYDVIVAPTDSGLNQIMNLGAKYKIAATITFGNFFVVSFGRDADETLNAGDKIIIFQENGIPGKTFKYLYGDLNLSITTVANASDTKQIIENNGVYDGVSYDYILTAEPVMSATNETAFLSIKDEFAAKTGGKLLTQASIFVKNGLDSTKVDKFLFSVKDNIEAGLANPAIIQSAIEQVGSAQQQQGAFGVPGAMAKKVSLSNGFGFGYANAYDIREDIKTFIKIVDPSVKL